MDVTPRSKHKLSTQRWGLGSGSGKELNLSSSFVLKAPTSRKMRECRRDISGVFEGVLSVGRWEGKRLTEVGQGTKYGSDEGMRGRSVAARR